MHKAKWYRPVAYLLLALAGFIYLYLIISTRSAGSFANDNMFVRVSLVLAAITVWFIALYSALRFRQYTYDISNREDGRALKYISNSLMLMVLYIVLITVARTLVRMFEHSSFLMPAVFMGNHLPLLIGLISAAMLYIGTEKLSHVSKTDIWSVKRYRLILLTSLGVFVWFAIQFYNSSPDTLSVNGLPRFSLPVNALVFTYVLPHILAWLLGVLACLHLATYAHRAPGTIYRALFQGLYKGLLLVFLCMFIVQYIILSSVSMEGFSPLVGLSYGVTVLAVIGFILIDRGTNQLARIEKV